MGNEESIWLTVNKYNNGSCFGTLQCFSTDPIRHKWKKTWYLVQQTW